MQPVSGRKPRTRKVSVQSAAMAIAGVEQPYPTYQFSRRSFIERKGHNPFSDAGLLFSGAHTTFDTWPNLLDLSGTDFGAVDSLVGATIRNLTDGSEAIVTSNTSQSVLGVLSGGVANNWDIGDLYKIIAIDNG